MDAIRAARQEWSCAPGGAVYQLGPPAPTLRPFIEHYWFVEGTTAEPLDLRVDVYVDGRADLVLPFGATYRRTVAGGSAVRFDGANLDAQRTAPIHIQQSGVGRTTGVRFHLGGVGPFTRGDLRAHTDRTPPLDAVFGPRAAALEDALRASGDPDVQAEHLDAFFLDARVDEDGHAPFRAALDALVAAGGGVSVADLAREAGLSVRQLQRLFARFLGIPPKTTGRIVRFQRALRALMSDPGTPLADVAHACGYFDQAHFVRDFRRMTGGGVPRGYRGYFPEQGPSDFAPNVVVFVQDPESPG